MGVYSVLLPDAKTVGRVADCKSVAIVGCTVCANSSIAFDREVPLAKLTVDEATGETTSEAVAVAEEAKRLKSLLEENGTNATVELLPGPCVLSAEREMADAELVGRCADAEAVVTLCCAGGTLGVERRLGKTVRIIPGMKTVGSSLSYTVVDKTTGLVYMDKAKCKMIRVLRD